MTTKSDQQILRLVTDSSFRNWCLGIASKEEERQWRAWAAQSIDRQQVVATAKRIVLELESNNPLIPDDKKYRNWEQLSQKIRITHTSSFPNLRRRNAIQFSLGWIATAAASLLLLVVSFLTLEYTDLITVADHENIETLVPELQATATDYGEQKVIALDSGTRITLNANSSLSHYDGWVYNDTVNVKLEGEAHFDVVSRSSNEGPVFRVETADGNIHVLGTRFVVNTWDEDTKVILEEGRVAIENERAADQKQHKATLQPNELAQFSKSRPDITIKNVNPKVFTSWKDGLFVFERAPLTAVAERIEKIFGKKVVIADFGLTTERVSGAVENDDLEVLLSALSQTLQITVIEQDDQIIFKNAVFEGSFYKQNTK